MTSDHLVFYDGTCGLCDQIVQLILHYDTRETFSFAPLEGSTAKKMLEAVPPEMKTADSLILIEDYRSSNPKFFILGKGALRICWLLGGFWAVPGILSWLPPFFYDWSYRLLAKNRHRFFKNTSCFVPKQELQHRFLP